MRCQLRGTHSLAVMVIGQHAFVILELAAASCVICIGAKNSSRRMMPGWVRGILVLMFGAGFGFGNHQGQSVQSVVPLRD